MNHYVFQEVFFLRNAKTSPKTIGQEALRIASSSFVLVAAMLFLLALPLLGQSTAKRDRPLVPRLQAPQDVSISFGTTTGGTWSGGTPDVFTVNDFSAVLSVLEVTERLSSGTPVQIVAPFGSISIDGPISWISNASLDLEASGDVAINANITATGDAPTLTITPQMASPGAPYSLSNGARITLSGSQPTLLIGGAEYLVINSVDSLQNVLGNLSLNYALGSDIDASPTWQWNPSDGYSGFVPLGDAEVPFTGTFDGMGHVITGLYMEWIGTNYVGLFGIVANSGTVKNVGLFWEDVRGYYYVGGLVGYNEGLISGTFNTGSVVGAAVGYTNFAGGLVGYNAGGGGDMQLPPGVITQSYSAAAVTGGWGVGGLTGETDGIVSNSYSIGPVTGFNPGCWIGGFSGWNNGSMASSYSAGQVSVTVAGDCTTIGGFVGGYGEGSTSTNNYYDQLTSQKGGGGATPLLTGYMFQQASFPNWDFNNVWGILEGFSYPYLRQSKQHPPFNTQCATQPPGLVGWWPAQDDGTDNIGNNNATLSSVSADYAPGVVKQAFNLHGSGYAENVEPSGAVNVGNQSWTVSAWVHTTASVPNHSGNVQEIVSRYSCGSNPDCTDPFSDALYEILVTATGQAQFHVRDNSSNEATAEGVTDLRDSLWHLVTGTLDRSAGQIRIYVDGVLQDTQDASAVGVIDDPSSPLEFGRLFRQGWADPDYYLTGQIDEVQIYNRALSAVEVQATFDAGSVGVCSAAPELSVSPTSLTFTAFENYSSYAPETVSVLNNGGGQFSWTASATQPWLSVTPTSGTTPGWFTVFPYVSRLPAGTYTDTITITANGATAATAEVAVTLKVLPLATTVTTLTSSPNPSPYGSVVTLTATVTGGSTVPTGTVTFIDETTPDAVSLPLDATGTAVYSSTFSEGTHSIIVVYNGDSGHLPSTTEVLTLNVSPPAPPTTATVITDPQPTVTTNPGEIILHKELHGTGGYGMSDGGADILYTGQAATWHFSLPASVAPAQIQSAFVRASLVADDHGYGTSPYSLAGWINNAFLGGGVAGLPYGAPPASIFTNWVSTDYPAPSAATYAFTLQNISDAASGDWIGVDWIELHLILQPCAAPPSGLVTWYPGDGNANDIFSGLNAVLDNGVSFAAGESGKAFSFNGQNQYVLVGDPVPSALRLQNQLTLQAWIYASSYPPDLGDGAMGLIVGSQYDTNHAGATIFLDGRTNSDSMSNPPGHVHFQIGDGSWHQCNTQSPVPLNQWVLITATRNANEDAVIYFNDVPQPLTCAPWSGSISYNGAWFAIGQQKDLNRPFNGLIDDVRVFNRSLTGDEVHGIYVAGSSSVCQVPTPAISLTSPKSVIAGMQYLKLVVYGSNFTTGSVVLWNGSPRVTTYVSEDRLEADILAADLASVSTAAISVQNPPPGGGVSGTLPFNVKAAGGGMSDMSLAAGVASRPVGSYPMYQAAVTNNGPDMATNAVVTVFLDRFQFTSATYTTGSTQGDCAFDEDSSSVTCHIGSMPSGTTGMVKVMGTPPSSGWASQEFRVDADQDDPVPINNSARVVSAGGDYNTAVGLNELVQTSDGTLIAFSSVTKAGTTTVAAGALTVAPPPGFRSGNPALLYNVNSSAVFSGVVVVAIPFNPASFHKPARARLFHIENGAWVDRTSGLDLSSGRISAVTTSLSSFAIFEPVNHPPVAAANPTLIVSATSAAGASVQLDASASTDPDADPLTYRWIGPFPEGNGTVTGSTPVVTLPLSMSKLTVVANDGETDSLPANLSVTVTDFTITSANASPTIKAGQSATVDLAVSPVYGAFGAPVTLSCPSLPHGLTCSFSPATVTPGKDAAITHLTISRSMTASIHSGRGWLMSYLSVAIFGFVCMPLRRRMRWCAIIFLTILLAFLIACGAATQTPSSSQASSVGNTTSVTVTGSAQSLQHSTAITVTLD